MTSISASPTLTPWQSRSSRSDSPQPSVGNTLKHNTIEPDDVNRDRNNFIINEILTPEEDVSSSTCLLNKNQLNKVNVNDLVFSHELIDTVNVKSYGSMDDSVVIVAPYENVTTLEETKSGTDPVRERGRKTTGRPENLHGRRPGLSRSCQTIWSSPWTYLCCAGSVLGALAVVTLALT